MSQNSENHGRKRTARERLQREREAHKAQERRRRVLVVSAAVVGILGLAAVVGVIAANAGKDKDSGSSDAGPLLAPAGVQGKDRLAIPVGASDAPSTLTVWEDFRCPVCAQFETLFKDTLHELERTGQIKIEYHLATIIDGNMGGTGSLRAANAAACAQDVGKFGPYHDVLFKNQPPEPDDAYGKNSRLIELAGQVDGLDTPAFRSCVEEGRHDSWVAKSNTAFSNGGFTGTPTVLLNGENIFPMKGSEQLTTANLEKWVTEANKGKQPGTERATVTPSAAAS